ncbi:MAG: hypothetical protein FWH43_03895 [Endomicrobia bacterium]|nr:hypothetical protein [Endomicrobiia bacterium]
MKKVISVFIALCLLETSVLGQGVFPSLPASSVSGRQSIMQDGLKILNYSNITSFKNSGSSFSAVIIQDLHCHPAVQKNISMILSQLCEEYKVKNIFVEGGAGDINIGWLRKEKTECLKK